MSSFYHAVLTVRLDAIRQNYKLLKEKKGKGACAVVVKANAYGLGVVPVAENLYAAGCRHFFVATVDEAVELRQCLADEQVSIYVFHGFYDKGELQECVARRLTPVISSSVQIQDWKITGRPCVLHIDTGMNRMGLSFWEAEHWVTECRGLEIDYVMSHLACADTPDDALSQVQLERFAKIRHYFPGIKTSLENSYGMFLKNHCLSDLPRPGMALYGMNPVPDRDNPMRRVVMLTTRIIALRRIDREMSVGYGASCRLRTGSVIATIPVGYADGYLRKAGNRAEAVVAGVKVPVAGRVSMDLMTLDVTAVPEAELVVGQGVELLGATISVDDVARAAGTIGYEVVTRLGRRFERRYIHEAEGAGRMGSVN